eukprot:Gb_28576 [translate_table: standard]
MNCCRNHNVKGSTFPDNEPLMRALSKLINLNQPDLVLFVGEALVGNDAVDQLTKFNQKLADLSTSGNPRLIDGILLTKFDTIDNKVGAALSMVYISGTPVMFVGCGQSYTDLKKLNDLTIKFLWEFIMQHVRIQSTNLNYWRSSEEYPFIG